VSAYFNGDFWTLKMGPFLGLCHIFGGHTPMAIPAPRAFRGVRQASWGCLLTVSRFSVNFDTLWVGSGRVRGKGGRPLIFFF
jgi:hypothetical protein